MSAVCGKSAPVSVAVCDSQEHLVQVQLQSTHTTSATASDIKLQPPPRSAQYTQGDPCVLKNPALFTAFGSR